MTRRVHLSEALALHSARDEARNMVNDLFPGIRMIIDIAAGENGRGLAARFTDPRPRHQVTDVFECLAEMGVHATMVDSLPQPTLPKK